MGVLLSLHCIQGGKARKRIGELGFLNVKFPRSKFLNGNKQLIDIIMAYNTPYHSYVKQR